MLQHILLVSAGGAIGAAMRYLVGEWLGNDGFPYATLSVNLLGSLVLGVVTVGIAQHVISENLAFVFATGFLGAFTTMSAYSVETIAMFDRGDSTLAFSYIGLTMLLCPILALIGWKVGESVWL